MVTNKGSLNGTVRYVWGAMALDPSGGVAWQCLEEHDGSGNLVARYTYAPGYIDSVAVQERDLNADHDFGDANEKVYYHSNTLYNVYALTDASEAVVERYQYDAYGGAAVLDADFSSDSDGYSDVDNPYTFTGRRLDLESGLMYYRNRQYDTTLGRFISRDPQGYDDWLSLYLYVASNPVNSGDPLGLYNFNVLRGAALRGKERELGPRAGWDDNADELDKVNKKMMECTSLLLSAKKDAQCVAAYMCIRMAGGSLAAQCVSDAISKARMIGLLGKDMLVLFGGGLIVGGMVGARYGSPPWGMLLGAACALSSTIWVALFQYDAIDKAMKEECKPIADKFNAQAEVALKWCRARVSK